MYLVWGAPGESDNLHAPPSNIKFIKRRVCNTGAFSPHAREQASALRAFITRPNPGLKQRARCFYICTNVTQSKRKSRERFYCLFSHVKRTRLNTLRTKYTRSEQTQFLCAAQIWCRIRCWTAARSACRPSTGWPSIAESPCCLRIPPWTRPSLTHPSPGTFTTRSSSPSPSSAPLVTICKRMRGGRDKIKC